MPYETCVSVFAKRPLGVKEHVFDQLRTEATVCLYKFVRNQNQRLILKVLGHNLLQKLLDELSRSE